MKQLIAAILVMLSLNVDAQQIRAMSVDEIIHYTSSKDTLYIINFWATWCMPCVAELSEFNDIKDYYAEAPVKVLLVSLDFKEDVGKLPMFIQRKRMTPEVVWLSDTNPNVFIPKIDNSWQGSIPATIMVHPGKGFKKFTEGQITRKQVCKTGDAVLNGEQH